MRSHVSAAAQYMIESGADVHVKDQEGNNALIYAGKARMYDVAKMIFKDNYFEDNVYKDFLKISL